jgi:Protein of unknown function (DUF2442)
MNPRVKEVKYEPHYKLVLIFLNNEVKEFNFSGYLDYPVYTPLKDELFCHKARVVNGTVAWDDEIDFDPDTLYLESKSLVTV